MAKGTIYVTAQVILHHLLRLQNYTLRDVQTRTTLNGTTELIFEVDAPELPGREDTVLALTPVYESKTDEDGTSWYRLKEVQVW